MQNYNNLGMDIFFRSFWDACGDWEARGGGWLELCRRAFLPQHKGNPLASPSQRGWRRGGRRSLCVLHPRLVGPGFRLWWRGVLGAVTAHHSPLLISGGPDFLWALCVPPVPRCITPLVRFDEVSLTVAHSREHWTLCTSTARWRCYCIPLLAPQGSF